MTTRPDIFEPGVLSRALRVLAANVLDAVAVADPAPVTALLYDRMRLPSLGDLVVETTTLGLRDRDLDAVGYLVQISGEFVGLYDPDFVWDETEECRERPTERIWYVRTLDGRVQRWRDARFVALPIASPSTAPTRDS